MLCEPLSFSKAAQRTFGMKFSTWSKITAAIIVATSLTACMDDGDGDDGVDGAASEAQLSVLNAEQSIWRSMKHYTSSVCINSHNNTVAINCPRANLVTYWQLNSGDFIASYKIKDGAGVTLLADNFIVSTGRGRIVAQQDPKQGYSIRGDFEP